MVRNNSIKCLMALSVLSLLAPIQSQCADKEESFFEKHGKTILGGTAGLFAGMTYLYFDGRQKVRQQEKDAAIEQRLHDLEERIARFSVKPTQQVSTTEIDLPGPLRTFNCLLPKMKHKQEETS